MTNIAMIVSTVLVTNITPEINPIKWNHGIRFETNVCHQVCKRVVRLDGTTNSFLIYIPLTNSPD